MSDLNERFEKGRIESVWRSRDDMQMELVALRAKVKELEAENSELKTKLASRAEPIRPLDCGHEFGF